MLNPSGSAPFAFMERSIRCICRALAFCRFLCAAHHRFCCSMRCRYTPAYLRAARPPREQEWSLPVLSLSRLSFSVLSLSRSRPSVRPAHASSLSNRLSPVPNLDVSVSPLASLPLSRSRSSNVLAVSVFRRLPFFFALRSLRAGCPAGTNEHGRACVCVLWRHGTAWTHSQRIQQRRCREGAVATGLWLRRE